MKNIITINSANIGTFGFQSIFDTELKKLTLDITGLTVFNGSGQANVPGIGFNIQDPSGITLASVDFTAPQIVPADGSTFEIDLPSVYAMFGWYTIQGVIKDVDAKEYSTQIIKVEICQPQGYEDNVITGDIGIDVDCDIPQLLITERTVFVYKNLRPASIVKTGTLYYPKGTLADLDFDTTPFIIGGSGNVYTGRYTINNKSVASYDLGDGVVVQNSYVVNGYEKVVDCQGAVAKLVCCVDEVKERYERDPLSATGKSAKAKLDSITIDFMSALIKEKAGQDPTAEVDRIKHILNCDCACKSSFNVEPRPVLGGGVLGTIINIVGAHAADVSSTTVGSTKTYTVDTRLVVVNKSDSDLAFSINKTQTSSQTTFTIAFDYEVLSATILSTIQNDDDLLTILRSLVNATGADIDLDGLDGSCIGVDLNTADYVLLENNVTGKVVSSISIGGVSYAAPAGLLLTNAAGIQTWLNGLAKGVFVVTYDSGAKTTLIQSSANTNKVNTLTLVVSSVPVVRSFSSTIKSLKDILQFIFDYLCTLPMVKVKLGNVFTVCEYDINGNVIQTQLAAVDNIGTLLSKMAAAQCKLINNISQALQVDCAAISNIFKIGDFNVNPAPDKDTILAKVNGACAQLTFDQFLIASLTKIATTSALKSQFCAIVNSCGTPVCDAATNVSGLLVGGGLKINANFTGTPTAIRVRYRLAGTSDTFTEVAAGTSLPYTVSTVPAAQYEVGVLIQCSNGASSDWVSGISTACPLPLQFTVSQDGSNFVVIFNVPSTQAGIEIEVTDPNNGKNTIVKLMTGVNTFNIPMTAGLIGNWLFRARAICDNTVSPKYYSAYTDYITIAQVGGCNPPSIVSVADQSSDVTYITKRVTFTGYTPTVRVRAYNAVTNEVVYNQVITGTGTADVVLVRYANFYIEIYNQCGGTEAKASIFSSTRVHLFNVKFATTSGAVCAATITTVYLSYNLSFVPGSFVFVDYNEVTPLLGYSFITDEAGVIYGLDPASGEILAATGDTCS